MQLSLLEQPIYISGVQDTKAHLMRESMLEDPHDSWRVFWFTLSVMAKDWIKIQLYAQLYPAKYYSGKTIMHQAPNTSAKEFIQVLENKCYIELFIISIISCLDCLNAVLQKKAMFN